MYVQKHVNQQFTIHAYILTTLAIADFISTGQAFWHSCNTSLCVQIRAGMPVSDCRNSQGYAIATFRSAPCAMSLFTRTPTCPTNFSPTSVLQTAAVTSRPGYGRIYMPPSMMPGILSMLPGGPSILRSPWCVIPSE